MKDWEYSFKPISGEEWFQQIEKDLRGQSLESLQGEWWEGEPILPFHHRADHVHFVALPDHYFAQPPTITEYVSCDKDPSILNKRVLNALEFGTQSLIFAYEEFSDVDLDKILEGVHRQMVQISIQPSKPEFDLHQFQGMRMRIVRDNRPAIEFFKHLSSSLDFRVVYNIPMGGSWIKEVSMVWQRLRDDLKAWKDGDFEKANFPETCILRISPDTHFLKQIIQTRVLQLLWLNETHEQGVRNSPVEVHIEPGEQRDPDKYLLNISGMSLASTLTGVGALCIHHMEDPEVPEHYRRNHRNVHHLLNLESQMGKGKDPIAGSVAVDHYTQKWSEAILSQLH